MKLSHGIPSASLSPPQNRSPFWGGDRNFSGFFFGFSFSFNRLQITILRNAAHDNINRPYRNVPSETVRVHRTGYTFRDSPAVSLFMAKINENLPSRTPSWARPARAVNFVRTLGRNFTGKTSEQPAALPLYFPLVVYLITPAVIKKRARDEIKEK